MPRPLLSALIVLVGGSAALAAFGGQPSIATLMATTFIWATVGLSWNLFSGLSGNLSIGHAGFFGIGAYVSVLMQIHFEYRHWSPRCRPPSLPRLRRLGSAGSPSACRASTSRWRRSPIR